ncbi:MAG: hypothetical protein ACLVAW_23180 [Eisenbergiella massiliensis]
MNLSFSWGIWKPSETLVASDVWKGCGYNSHLLAALTAIDQSQYEAAKGTTQAILNRCTYYAARHPAADHPGDGLGMGNILNTGFDQVFNLYSPIV